MHRLQYKSECFFLFCKLFINHLISFSSEKQANVEMCTKQLERATELIGGLGGEGERWLVAAEKLGEVYETLTGTFLVVCLKFTSLMFLLCRRCSHSIWSRCISRTVHQRF